MRRLLFAGISAVALLSGTALVGAKAAPVAEMARHELARQPSTVQHVDYRWHGHPFHHRRWEHHHWSYY